jgi:hypothetical protein
MNNFWEEQSIFVKIFCIFVAKMKKFFCSGISKMEDPDPNPNPSKPYNRIPKKMLSSTKTRFDGTFVNTNDSCRGMDSRKKVVCGVAATVIIWLVSFF